ncbi:MAG: hypothetical protein IPK67_18315 [Planctomycetes bacterium]|nr:hypothetical protein [Planctomycetota bacterium]
MLVDQPVRPGDFCRVGDKVGTVGDIGVRSTRIRTRSHRDRGAQRGVLGAAARKLRETRPHSPDHHARLRHETTPDPAPPCAQRTAQDSAGPPQVLPDPQRVRMVGFGAYSLDLEVFAYVGTQDFNEFLAVREDIFLRMMRVIEETDRASPFRPARPVWRETAAWIALAAGRPRTRWHAGAPRASCPFPTSRPTRSRPSTTRSTGPRKVRSRRRPVESPAQPAARGLSASSLRGGSGACWSRSVLEFLSRPGPSTRPSRRVLEGSTPSPPSASSRSGGASQGLGASQGALAWDGGRPAPKVRPAGSCAPLQLP